jgi:hypothetical protein
MNRFVFVALAGALFVGSPVSAQVTGSGFPSGNHYTLNVLGKTNCAGSSLTGSNRHTIQVLLNFTTNKTDLIDRTNKIFLQPGADFQVLDGNACDTGGALFQLPSDVSTAWTAWAEALGKPGGNANIVTCGVDSGTVICAPVGNTVNLTRNSGKPFVQNVTNKLFFVCNDTNLDTVCQNSELVPIFSDIFQQVFWAFDNNGLRLAQIRFYPVQ